MNPALPDRAADRTAGRNTDRNTGCTPGCTPGGTPGGTTGCADIGLPDRLADRPAAHGRRPAARAPGVVPAAPMAGPRATLPATLGATARRCLVAAWCLACTTALAAAGAGSAAGPGAPPQPAATAGPAAAEPLAPVARLDVPAYMGTWYQVAYYPNRFQRRCVSDTRATYRQREDGRIEVANRCREADGRTSEATGLARPAGSTLQGPVLSPAALEVSFLPRWLHWVPAWGSYWVIDLAPDGRYAVVSEPQRRYLWVLARAPRLQPDDEAAIRSLLVRRGFDLARLQAHPHTETPPAP